MTSFLAHWCGRFAVLLFIALYSCGRAKMRCGFRRSFRSAPSYPPGLQQLVSDGSFFRRLLLSRDRNTTLGVERVKCRSPRMLCFCGEIQA